MTSAPKTTFIGAGSTIFVKNIFGDVFHRDALKLVYIVLMDFDLTRLEESYVVVCKLMDSAGVSGRITCCTDQKMALQDVDFAVVVFQIGGCKPCTATDFTVCKRHGLEQMIASTLGPGGIMHVPHTIPHLQQTCEDVTEVHPQATTLNYVNPIATNTWAMYACYPHIKQARLCHSVQGMTGELACDLSIDPVSLRYHSAGINHMAFHLELECKTTDGAHVNLYPELLAVYESGQAPKPNIYGNTRCQNIVRHEMFKKLGYFTTESSEHFTGYMPRSIKPEREDLIERYRVSLDEYLKRCVGQLANWKKKPEEYKTTEWIDIKPLREYASTTMNAIWTGEPSVVYGNVRNDNLIDNLPQGCCVEVVCLVDTNGIQPTKIGIFSPHLVAMIQTNINAQTPPTEAIPAENRGRVYHAVMMDPHTAVVLGIEEIYALVGDLITSHGDWLPAWLYR